MIEIERLRGIIKTVGRIKKWEPAVIGGLFLDDKDHHGLLFWYDDIIEESEEIKSLMNRK